MFTADEFQLIENRCWLELEKLLQKISVSIPYGESSDKFRIYDKLSSEITNKMCRLLKSNSVVEGYTKLLKLGGIAYDFSETDNELLDKVIANKEKIFQSDVAEKNLPPQKPIDNFEIKISRAKNFSSQNLLAEISRLETLLDNSYEQLTLKTRRFGVETHETREYPKNFRVMKNEISNLRDYVRNLKLLQVEKISVTVPLENLPERLQEYATAFIEVKKFSQPVRQAEPPKIIFSADELEKIFEVLEQVNKIYKSI